MGKNRFSILLRLICLASGFALSAPPVGAHQPHDPIVAIGVSPAYPVDQTVFVATDYTSVTIGAHVVLKSSDGGNTWTVVSDLPNYKVMALVVSPNYAQGGTVFAASQGGGLYRTTDRGLSWAPVGVPIGKFVVDVALSPNYGAERTLFAVNAANLIFKSIDGGRSWTELPSPAARNFNKLVLSPNYRVDQTLLLGSFGGGIFKSTDGGDSWAAVSPGLSDGRITAIAFSPSYASDRSVFVGTFGDGVFASRDSGTTWTPSNAGISDLEITAISVSPYFELDSKVFAASATAGVFKSTNGGASWTEAGKINRGLDGLQASVHFRELAVAPSSATETVVFLGMFEGFWKFAEGEGTWQFLDILPTHLVRSIALSPDYQNDQALFASTYGGGVLSSLDGGHTWMHQNTGLISPYPDPLALSPNYASDGVLFCGTAVGLQRVTGSGTPWKMMAMLGVPTFARALGISPAFNIDRTVFIGTFNLQTTNPKDVLYNGRLISNDGLFISTDGGGTSVPTGLNGPPIQFVALSPQFPSDHTVFAASLLAELYKSTDHGATWRPLQVAGNSDAVFAIALSPAYAEDQTLFVSAIHGNTFNTGGVFKSTDGGTSWFRVPGSGDVTVLDIALSPNYPADQTLFVATVQKGLLISVDGGNSLRPTALPSNYVTSLAVSPAYAIDRTVFAATYRGIFKSEDSGATWNLVSTHTRYEPGRPNIGYVGPWLPLTSLLASSIDIVASSTPFAKIEFSFVGSGVRWISEKGPGHGIAVVYLDGVLQNFVDLYAPIRFPQRSVWEKLGLSHGRHTLTITVIRAQNPRSSGHKVILDAFDVWLTQDTRTLFSR